MILAYDKLQSFINFLGFNLGIEAGSEGTVVEDAQHRQRITILDSGGQIAFAGHGNNQFRPFLGDDLPGQSTSRGNRYINTIFFRQFRQPRDIASAAAYTLADGAGHFYLAVKKLDTMGK